MCTHTHTHTHTHARTHARTHAHRHTHTRARAHARTHALVGAGTDREREREGKIHRFFLNIYEKNRYHACMHFYIQPLPKQGTIPDLIIHVHIFQATTHLYTHGIKEAYTSNMIYERVDIEGF